MTKNEKRVRAVFPQTTIERHTDLMGGNPYYLVREKRNAYMYIGSGDTRAQAWKEAAESRSVADAEAALSPEAEPESTCATSWR